MADEAVQNDDAGTSQAILPCGISAYGPRGIRHCEDDRRSGNGIRIVTLSTLAIYADPSFLTGKLHNEGGFVFFLLALAILAPVLWLLQRSEANH